MERYHNVQKNDIGYMERGRNRAKKAYHSLSPEEKEELSTKKKYSYHANKDFHQTRQKIYDDKNRQKRRDSSKRWKLNNRDKVKAYQIQNKDRLRSLSSTWAKNNLDRRNFNGAKRRALKLKATPSWLTDNDWIEIRRYYKVSSFLTKKTGIKYCVDHIHPLQGENVCGLHVPWNLQILTDIENASKGNKLI